MNTEDRTKKIAVISGGFGYVGLAVARRLSKAGFSLALLYKNTTEEECATRLKELTGEGHRAYKCDLTNAEEVANILSLIEQEQGTITIAVHAAGQKPDRKKLHLTTLQELESQLQNNVVASFNFLTAFGKNLKEHRSGVLVGITTIGLVVPDATKSLGGYIPAKYAVQGMLTMLRDELAPSGVRVYAIAPGFMPDGMNADIPKAFVQMIEAKVPDKKLAQASDIADKIQMLYDMPPENDVFVIPIAPEYGM